MADRNLRLQMLFAAMDKATGPIKNIRMGAGQLGGALKASREELDKLNKSQSNLRAFVAIKSQARETAAALAAAEAKTASLAREMTAAEKPSKALTRSFEAAKRESAGLKSTHQAQREELQRLRSSLSEAGIHTSKLVTHERELKVAIGKANDALGAQQAKLDQHGRQQRNIADGRARMGQAQERAGVIAQGGATAVAAGAGLAAPLVVGAREAMTFQGALVDIQKVMPNLTPTQLQEFASALTVMSETIPISREGLATIAAEGARVGIASKDLMEFTRNAAMMGSAFEIEAGDAGGMMAKWGASMGIPQAEVVALADKVNALTNKFGGNAANVSDMITRLGSLGKVAGVSGGQIAAMAQYLDKSGVQSEVGATGIKNMMLALTKGGAATKQQEAAFAQLGLKATDVSERMVTDSSGAIESVLGKIALLPKAQQSGVLTMLFGSESVSAIAPLLTGLDEVKKNFQLVGDQGQWAGSMQSEFNTAMTKTSNQMLITQNAGNNLLGVFGGALLPAIEEGAKFFRSITGEMTKFFQKHPTLAAGIGLIVGGLAALLIVGGGLAIMFAGLMAPFAAFSFAMTMLPVAGAALAAMAAPIAIFIAAAVVIGTVAYLIWKNWDWLKKQFAALWTWMTTSPMAFILGPVALLAKGADYIIKNWGSIKGFFSKLWTDLTGMWNKLPESLRAVGANMIARLIAGITGNGAGVATALTNIIGQGVKAAKDFLGIKSPSVLMKGMGVFTMQGYNQGLDDEADGPIKRMRNLARGMAHAINLPNTLNLCKGLAAAGVATLGAISGPSTALAAPRTSLSAPAPAIYNLTFNVPEGAKAKDIALQVRLELERLERERGARARATFDDI